MSSWIEEALVASKDVRDDQGVEVSDVRYCLRGVNDVGGDETLDIPALG